jgi:hypothetical protein
MQGPMLELSDAETGREFRSTPTPVEGPDILDWDAAIDSPPPRPSGDVTVRLEPSGRSRPMPVDDPRAE